MYSFLHPFIVAAAGTERTVVHEITHSVGF